MRGRRSAALMLAVFWVCLSGCSVQKPEPSPLCQAAEVEETAVLLTVDGREVPAWRCLCWLAFTCGQVRQRYQEAGLTLDWSTPVTGGTLGDYAKDQAIADAALYATVENWAEERGCALTDGEQEALEDPDPETAALWGVTPEQGRELAAVGALYGKLSALWAEEAPPPEDALWVDRILVSHSREDARETVEALFARLNSAQDQEGAFRELAAAWDDPAGPRALREGEGSPLLADAARALEEGQCSGILETEEGYSILRRLPPGEDPEAGAADFDRALQEAADRARLTVAPEFSRLEPSLFQDRLDSLLAEGFSSR